MKRIIRKLISLSSTQKGQQFLNLSYSQEGEDLILKRVFENKAKGCFIDIGAHHPQRFSNTYIFYINGWTGINIDPLPGTKALFEKERPKDTSLEFGISAKEQILTYYMFNEPALNTFDEAEAKHKDGINNGQFFITEKKEIKTLPLKSILDQYLEKGRQIDFLTIDVEGLDMEVLTSNDWIQYRPTYILVEELRLSMQEIIATSKVYAYLNNQGYSLMYRTMNTSFYKKNN